MVLHEIPDGTQVETETINVAGVDYSPQVVDIALNIAKNAIASTTQVETPKSPEHHTKVVLAILEGAKDLVEKALKAASIL